MYRSSRPYYAKVNAEDRFAFFYFLFFLRSSQQLLYYFRTRFLEGRQMKERQDRMKRLIAALFFSYFSTVLSFYLSLSFHGHFRSIVYHPLLSFMLYPVIVPGMICFSLTLNLNERSQPWVNFAIFFSHLSFLVAIYMVMFLTGNYFSIQ